MSGVIIFFFVFFLVFMMSGPWQKGTEHKAPKNISRRRVKNWAKAQAQQSVQPNYDDGHSRKGTVTPFDRGNQARFASGVLKRGVDVLDGMDSVRDPHDKNRHRRSDWGSRAGPGILSLKNTFLLLLAGLAILWMISSFPA